MIFRLVGSGQILDFGSEQAANQFLDNYPPHIKAQCSLSQLTLEQCEAAISQLSTQVQQIASTQREDSVPSAHFEWLMSRVEMYQAELGLLQRERAVIEHKVSMMPTRPN